MISIANIFEQEIIDPKSIFFLMGHPLKIFVLILEALNSILKQVFLNKSAILNTYNLF